MSALTSIRQPRDHQPKPAAMIPSSAAMTLSSKVMKSIWCSSPVMGPPPRFRATRRASRRRASPSTRRQCPSNVRGRRLVSTGGGGIIGPAPEPAAQQPHRITSALTAGSVRAAAIKPCPARFQKRDQRGEETQEHLHSGPLIEVSFASRPRRRRWPPCPHCSRSSSRPCRWHGRPGPTSRPAQGGMRQQGRTGPPRAVTMRARVPVWEFRRSASGPSSAAKEERSISTSSRRR